MRFTPGPGFNLLPHRRKQRLAVINEDLLQNRHRHFDDGHGLLLLMRMEVVGLESLVALLGPMAVGRQGENRSGVVPSIAASALGHPHQFSERQSSGIKSEDAGEFPDEPISVLATASGSTSLIFVSA